MKCRVISIDLAKSVFQACGVNQQLKPLFNQKLSRRDFYAFMAQQPPTQVVMEACYSSHYWGRELTQLGHTVRLIPAQHVTPFVRGNKNDRNDALAIVEASQRPNIRFVPIKTQAQQEVMALHRIRERLIKNKTALTNQAHGLLSDFDIIFSPGERCFSVMAHIVAASTQVSQNIKSLVAMLHEEFLALKAKLKTIEAKLKQNLAQFPQADILLSVPGIGYIVASALIACIDKGQAFQRAKDFAVWLGITPRQYASGAHSYMGKISKRGNRYLRKQLIHGARAVLNRYKNDQDALKIWGETVAHRRGFNKAVVAIAHKLARIVWHLLQKDVMYQPQPIKA